MNKIDKIQLIFSTPSMINHSCIILLMKVVVILLYTCKKIIKIKNKLCI